MELLNKETIESIYEKATNILATVGVKFDLASAVEMFKKKRRKSRGEKSLYLSVLVENGLGFTAKDQIYSDT